MTVSAATERYYITYHLPFFYFTFYQVSMTDV